MRAAQLFALAIGVVLVIGFAFSRSTVGPKGPRVVRMTTRDGNVVEVPMQPRSGTLDPRLGSYLRQALVFEEMYRADQGSYTSDISKITVDRPANTTLHIIRVGENGIRMSAINSQTEIQCDVFAGDSAHWAFGYAYDSRMPRCGKLR
jgi:hypothetical protein